MLKVVLCCTTVPNANAHLNLDISSLSVCVGEWSVGRVQRVGVFNFRTDRVWVFEEEKIEFGYGSGWDIGSAFFINRILSGIENLDRYFLVTFLIKLFSFGSTGFLSFLWLKKAAGPNI